MNLKGKMLHPSVPVIFFETVPPAPGKEGAIEAVLDDVKKIRHLVDAVNLPEIRDETRHSERTYKFVPRVEPRVLGTQIRRELGTDVVINRVVVHESDQLSWFRETGERFGLEHAVLVGGESSRANYAGPSVLETAGQVRAAGLPWCLGGITIPSRTHEADRIRRKHAAGLKFFTTQVLFDSNDIVGLVQRLNSLEARIFLSFAPVSHPRDLDFLRWLGVDLPKDLDTFLLRSGPGGASCFDRSLDLAQRILMDVFDNLPPDPPLLGLNIEHINRRNFAGAVKMLDRLGDLYSSLVAARPNLA